MNKHNRNRFTDNRKQTSGYLREECWARSKQVKGVRGTKLLGTNKRATNIWCTMQKIQSIFYNNFIWRVIYKNTKLL